MSIFKVQDIDTILMQFLSIDDLRILCQVNKHYNNLIRPLLQEYYNFFDSVENIKCDISYNNNTILSKAVRFGNINVCKYLLNKYIYGTYVYDNTFYYSCEIGNLNVAKLLYSIKKVDIHRYDDQVFRLSCQNGHLNVAEWLFSLGNVNIHTNDDFAFRYSCQTGHLNVAQWLFSLGNVNIHSNSDSAFRYSCQAGHLNVAQWLCTLCSRYSIKQKIEAVIN